MKPIIWHPEALKAVRGFPSEVQTTLGGLIMGLQNDQELPKGGIRSFNSIAQGVKEIRARGADGIFRIFVFQRIKKVTVCFHAFQKKGQKTPKKEIETGKKRLKEILNSLT